tara:strand:- start:287 stop:946 length:660 start_codon:yes stop_codon:yes gene_type:complete
MIDSTFLKEDTKLMSYLTDNVEPFIKKILKDDTNWKLGNIGKDSYPLDEIKNEICGDDYKRILSIKDNKSKDIIYPKAQNLYKYKRKNKIDMRNFVIAKKPSIYDNAQSNEQPLYDHLKRHFKGVIDRRDWYLYKKNNFMGYHTNASDKTQYRVYFVWADEDNKSFFRYYDRDNDKLVTVWDKKGWNINYFKLGDYKNNSPHCIYSECNRISYGFRVTK